MLPSIASARWNAGDCRDVVADQLVVLRIAGDDGAVAMDHRDRGVAVQRQRATKSSKWVGSTPRLAKPMISPLRPTILRANTVVQTFVTLLTTGSTITSGVGLPDVKSWK